MSFYRVFLLMALLSISAFATVLGDLAASMQPKSWAQLTTTGFNSSLVWIVGGGGEDAVFNYSDDLTWDSQGEMVHYIGGSHYGPGRYITYTAATNSWRRETDPSFVATLGHGYDHNAMDQSRRWFYHNPMSARSTVWRYEITNDRWVIGASMPSTIAIKDELACCRGLCFYPDFSLNGEKGGLVYANGRVKEVYYFGTSTGKWLNLGSVNMAGYHNIAKYNPVQKGVYLGGGNGMTTLAFMDSLGTFHQMASAPHAIGIFSSATTVCPVTGDLLALTEGGNFYSYHLATDTWTKQSNSPLTTIIYTVCGTINNYGVTMWCQTGSGGNNTKIYLYKHAQMSGVQAGGSIPADGTIEVHPNPFKASATINYKFQIANYELKGVQLAIYDINGRCIKDFTNKIHNSSFAICNSVVWDASGLPAGIYILKAVMGGRTYTRRLFLQK